MGVPGRWLVTRGEFGADEFVHNSSVHLPPEKVLLLSVFSRAFCPCSKPLTGKMQSPPTRVLPRTLQRAERSLGPKSISILEDTERGAVVHWTLEHG